MAEKPRKETVAEEPRKETVAEEPRTTVTFLSAPAGAPANAVRVDDVELTKGQPVEGLTDDQVTRLQALPGLRFQVDPQSKER